MNADEDFLKKIRATFKVEADDHLKALTSGLLALEKTADSEAQKKVIETIYRVAHTLKGASRAMNITEIETLCQALETVFAALKRGDILITNELLDALHLAVDTIGALLSSPQDIQTPQLSGLLKQLALLLPDKSVEEKPLTQKTAAQEATAFGLNTRPQPVSDRRSLSETIRVSTAKLDSLLFQAEEMLSVKLSAAQFVNALRDIKTSVNEWKKELTKFYPELRKLAARSNENASLNRPIRNMIKSAVLTEFISSSETNVKLLESKLEELIKSEEKDYRSLSGMVDNLLEDTKKVLMLPASTLLDIFPKLVRDLSHDKGKEAELRLQGGDIEISRHIMEELKDPLIHLIRNCIDHGLEKPQVREKNRKAPQGTISISISEADSGRVSIVVSDDGAGIAADKVKDAAIARGIITAEQADKLDRNDILNLIFQSDLSTSPIITDLSGRGLGLAIVLEKIQALGGLISIETAPGYGTTFNITLPMTLVTFRGVLVKTAGRVFVLPTTNIERVARIRKDDLKTVGNRETILLNGRVIPFVGLDAVLELPVGKSKGDPEFIQALILGSHEKYYAFGIDEVLHEQEVLVKRLGKQLTSVRNIAGATVLGSGMVVPILKVSDLIKSALKVSTAPLRMAGQEAAEALTETRSILIAEDSITSRTLLKNILETSGYHVKATVDGLDAWTALRSEEFDLVVSDVEMPRMSGFELTTRIRSDRKLAELPVILVTALQSREDREKGIEVGANAYIVKSSFDQSNLLEVIKRLI